MALMTARDYADRAGVAYLGARTLIVVLQQRGHRDELGRGVPNPGSGQAVGPPVVARANHGRWIGDCNLLDGDRNRRCAGAQLIDPGDPQFWCVVCFNGQVQGRWRTVQFPADVAAVEADLAHLGEAEQNWEPPAGKTGPDPDPPIFAKD